MAQAFITAVGAPLAASASSFSSTPLRCTHQRTAAKSQRSIIYAATVPAEIDEDSFEKEILDSELPVLVDFYAPWCGPCKLVSPLMDWAAIEYDGQVKVAKIDTDSNGSFVKRYEIHGLPTFAVFKDGEAYGVKEGAMGRKQLCEYVKEHTGIAANV